MFCTIRCILYPGTKIIIASGTRSQAEEVLKKVTDDFCKLHDWGSSNLRNEINWLETKIGMNDSRIVFKNGSFMAVVTANDNSRSKRATIIVVDEARMVDLDVINTVLRRFLTAPRTPGYLNKPEYAHLIERNKEIYMSSAWLKINFIFT
jgi:tRNA(Met) C34 N-acetyltransferase TmcA